MTNANNRPDAHARVVLRMIGNRDKVFGDDVRDQIVHMQFALDQVMTRVPENPPENMVAELDRLTNTLRTADHDLFTGKVTTAMRALDLANARLEKFAKMVERHEDESARSPSAKAK